MASEMTSAYNTARASASNKYDKTYEAATAMVETVSTLFPCAEVRVGRPDSLADREFGFFPSIRRPNLVLPAENKRAAARTVWRFSAASRTRDIAARSVTSAVLRIGALKLTTDSILVYGDGESVTDHLEEVLGCPVAVSVGIGSARANRKPVLEVFDRRGRSLAFAKVGVDQVSRRDVERESKNLCALQSANFARVITPRLLAQTLWRGHRLLVMTPLPTSWQRPGIRRLIPTSEMADLSGHWGTLRVELAATRFWDHLHARVERLQSGPVAESLAGSMEAMTQRWGSTVVETGAWHGDWTPWNMAWRRRTLQLWDFERFDRDGLFGLDLLHYVLNEEGQGRRLSADEVVRIVAEGMARLRVREGAAAAVAACYLAAIAVRYQTTAEGPQGGLIAERAALMTRALALWLASPALTFK